MLCDVAYLLQLERFERQFLADRVASVTAQLTAGVEASALSWDGECARFDAALAAPPAPYVAPVVDLLTLLGVA